MVWTVLAVAGIACLVAAAFLIGGAATSLIVLGLALILVAVDGRRS